MRRLLFILLLLIASSAFATDPETEDGFILGIWDSVPKVILCEDAPVSGSRLQIALDWWKARGHQFHIVPLSEDGIAKAICQDPWGSFPKGYIVIAKLVDAAIRKENDMAVTYHYQRGGENNIEYAKVFFKHQFVHEARIVEHELGHAFGFGHREEAGHMMHTYYVYGGWLDKGLIERGTILDTKRTGSARPPTAGQAAFPSTPRTYLRTQAAQASD